VLEPQYLYLEKAPKEHAGGNSRVCGQGFIAPSPAIWDEYFKYYKAMTAGIGMPVLMILQKLMHLLDSI